MATDSPETAVKRPAKTTKAGPAVVLTAGAPTDKPDGLAGTPESPEINGEEERILRAATIHLVHRHGGLLVATGLREQLLQGTKAWVISVTLRHPTGHEGYIGDLLFDGKEFEFLTPPDVRKERAERIAADPEGIRLWNEYRDSASVAAIRAAVADMRAGDRGRAFESVLAEVRQQFLQ